MTPPSPRQDALTAGLEDEERLLARLRAGDAAAFESLVRAHGGRMLVVARRILRSEEDANDAVQEAFLSAFRALDRFHGEARLSTWLHRIVVNACLMKQRARRRRPEERIEGFLPQFDDEGHPKEIAVDWRSDPEQAAEREHTRRRVRECIDRLPETYRTVLILRDIEENDTSETADLLGVSSNAVKIRLHRARQALRSLLDPHFREASA